MLTVWIVYYSRSGSTRKLANAIANELVDAKRGPAVAAHMVDLQEPKKRGLLNALFRGVRQGRFGRDVPLKPLPALPAPDRLLVLAPVWGGAIAPALQTWLRKTPLKGIRAAGIATCGGQDAKYAAALKEKLHQAGCGACYAESIPVSKADRDKIAQWVGWLLAESETTQ